MSQRRKNDKRDRKRKKRSGGGKKERENLWVTTGKMDTPACPVCGKPITELYTAIASEDEDKNPPVHFDCAVSQIKENEALKNNEKVRYIGSGQFAVIEEIPKDEEHPLGFVIKRRIHAETTEYKHPWREIMKSELKS